MTVRTPTHPRTSESRRRGRFGRRPAPAAAGPPETPTRSAPARAPRSAKRKRLLQSLGLYEVEEETIFTSTRQAGCLNTALVSTHPPLAGPIMGIDVETGQPVCTDPHELYTQKRITAPNVVILGDVGSAKSSLVKTQYVLRAVACGRTVAVFDRKNQEGVGEYERAAQVCDEKATVLRFDRSGGTRINLLDPKIATRSVQTKAGPAAADNEVNPRVGQDRLLVMVAEHAHGPLTSDEHWALRTAHRTALARAQAAGRVAVLADVVDALYNPEPGAVPRPHLESEGIVTRRRVIEWGLGLAMDLERLIDGDLSGLLDGETTLGDDLEDASLIVFDTSAIDEDDPALAILMAVVASYLTSRWSTRPGRKRIIVLEEGYHTTRLHKVASILRSLAKRGRGIGLAFVTVVHHLGDVPPDSDAMSLIRETQIVHIYQQSRDDDIAQVITMFGLPDWASETLGTLQPGQHILRINVEPARLVRHMRTRLEKWVTDTDQAMTGDVQRRPAPEAA